jgi:hypothetical protein
MIMKIARLAGLVFVAVMAVSLAVASTASAIPLPLFAPVEGQLVSATSGTSILTGGGDVISCTSSVFHGFVLSSLLIGNAQIHYLGCTATGEAGTVKCTIKSKAAGSGEGLILTNTVHGILGLVLPSGAIGILFLPTSTSSKVFVELEESKNGASKCTPATKVEGDIIGGISPIGVSSKTGKTTFALSNKKQEDREIDLTHGLGHVEAELIAFSATSTLSQENLVTFAIATEVT